MSSSHKSLLLWIFSVCSVVLAVLLWRTGQSVSELRSQLETATKASRNPPVSRPVAAVPSSTTPASNLATGVSSGSAPATSGKSEGGTIDAFVGNPELDRLVTQKQKWANLAKNEAALAGLALARDKKSRLHELLFARGSAEQDIRALAARQNLTPQERTAAMREMIKNSDQEIQALLGAEDYAKYQQAVQENAFKSSFIADRELQGAFISAGTSLTPAQWERLAQTVYEENKIAESAPGAITERRVAVHAAVVNKASSFLDPVQKDALSRFLEADRQLGMQIERELNK